MSTCSWKVSRTYCFSQLLNVLRTHLRMPRTPLHLHLPLRTLSTTTTRLVIPRTAHVLGIRASPILSRSFSLASLFSPRKPVSTPSPSVVANIATIEADADVNPRDVRKQLALFDALMATKVKPAYDVVIARWERMCEFVSGNQCTSYRNTNRYDRTLQALSSSPTSRFKSISRL